MESLFKAPSIGTEEIESANASSGTVVLDRYIFDSALGRTKIDAGAWVFNTFGYVNNQAGTSSIPVSVYKVMTGVGTLTTTGTIGATTRTATISGATPFLAGDANADITLSGLIQTSTAMLRITGFTNTSTVTVTVLSGYLNQSTVAYSIHRWLFTDSTTEVNNEAVGLITSKSIQPEFTTSLTDKLSIAYFARSTANRTLYLYHGGVNYYTYFETPLAVLHNELAGIQGGATDEKYHLSSAKYTDLQNTTGTNTGDVSLGTASGLSLGGQVLSLGLASAGVTGALSGTDWTTFNSKQNALGYTPVNKAGDTVSGNLAITGYTTIAGLRKTPVIKTSAYTVTVNDSDVTGNSATPFNIQLLPATGTGAVYNIANVGSGIVTVVADISGTPDLINGSASQALEQGDSITIKDELTNIWIIQ
jgi:hypothetical protein